MYNGVCYNNQYNHYLPRYDGWNSFGTLKAIAVSDASVVVCAASHEGMMPPPQKTRNESAESVLPEPAGVIPRDELAEVPYRL